MNAFFLMLTVFMVTMGRLGDIYGRRRVLCTGVIVFALASFLAGTAWACEHLWIRYAYSGDLDDLEFAYPIIKGAVQCYMGMLIEEPKHGVEPGPAGDHRRLPGDQLDL